MTTPEEEAALTEESAATSPEQDNELGDAFDAATGTEEERKAYEARIAQEQEGEEGTPAAEAEGGTEDKPTAEAESKAGTKKEGEGEPVTDEQITELEKAVEEAEGDEAKAEAQKALDEAKQSRESAKTAAERADERAQQLEKEREQQAQDAFINQVAEKKGNVRELLKDPNLSDWLDRQPVAVQDKIERGNVDEVVEVLTAFESRDKASDTGDAATETDVGKLLDSLNDVEIPHAEGEAATVKALRDEVGDGIVSGIVTAAMHAMKGQTETLLRRIDALEKREALTPEALTPIRRQLAEVNLYRELAKKGHADAEQIETTQEFEDYRKNHASAGVNRLLNSWNAEDVAIGLEAYKEYMAGKQKGGDGDKHKRRVDLHKDTLKGSGARTPASEGADTPESFDDGFDAATKEQEKTQTVSV